MKYYKTSYKNKNYNEMMIYCSENCCNLPSGYKLLNISIFFLHCKQQSRNREKKLL